jgi:predicted dehydrogenase
MSNIRIGIIGAGYIAQEHLKVIQAMDGVVAAGITSRTNSKAERLSKVYDVNQIFENIDNLIEKCDLDALMILVSANQIFEVTKKLIPTNIPLFIEKPAGLIPDETKILAKLADKCDTKNMVGYNRRYYSIFDKGIELINQNGGLLGVTVEGHERFWKIAGKDIPNEIQENWIYCNSTHTIDLLRFFGGEIKSISSLSKSLKEKNGDQFVASMEFKSGALGTYASHWYSPGGWTATLYSEGATVKFKPLEKGVWIDTNLSEYEIYPDGVDVKYKPGFYRQMESFVEMVRNGCLKPPGMNLEKTLKTMELAKIFFNA